MMPTCRRPARASRGLLAGLTVLIAFSAADRLSAARRAPALLVLDRNAERTAVSVADGSRVTVRRGDVVLNSPSRTGLRVTGSVVEALSGAIELVGGHVASGGRIAPQPTRTAALADPLRSLDPPERGRVVSGSTRFTADGGSATFGPGTYVGGISVGSDGRLKLKSGVYVLVDGDFFCASDSKVEGFGVTLVFAGDDPGRLSLAPDAHVNLAPPRSGDLAGITLVSRATELAATLNGASATLGGVVYAPRGKVLLMREAGMKVDRLICLSLQLGGNSELQVNGAAAN